MSSPFRQLLPGGLASREAQLEAKRKKVEKAEEPSSSVVRRLAMFGLAFGQDSQRGNRAIFEKP